MFKWMLTPIVIATTGCTSVYLDFPGVDEGTVLAVVDSSSSTVLFPAGKRGEVATMFGVEDRQSETWTLMMPQITAGVFRLESSPRQIVPREASDEEINNALDKALEGPAWPNSRGPASPDSHGPAWPNSGCSS